MDYANGEKQRNGEEQAGRNRFGIPDDAFRVAAVDMVDYVINYYKTIGERQPFPDVKPGFMREILPSSPPDQPGSWDDLRKDFEEVVMKGMAHWQSPRHFGFFPCVTSYPSLLGGFLCDALSCLGFTWEASPSCTELETVMLDWLAEALGLPSCFRHEGKGPGCGVMQSSASESTLMTLLSARTKAISKELSEHPELTKHDVLSRLVAYTSEYSHSSVGRAGTIAMVTMRKLPVDKNISMRGETLRRAISKDRADGMLPIYFCATLGTTTCCSFDNVQEIGKICKEENIWLHVDAAYAGNALICPEFRHLMEGLEDVDSFSCNLHKWLMVNYDGGVLWVKNSPDLINSLHVNPLYLQHENMDAAIDYRHWQIPLSRRFRSLKLWFLFRLTGVEGIRQRVREDVSMARLFEACVRNDPRFEVVFPVKLALVCFRLVKNRNDPMRNRDWNERLLKRINESREIYLIASEAAGIYFLRVSVGTAPQDDNAIFHCWDTIRRHATDLLREAILPKKVECAADEIGHRPRKIYPL